MKSDCIVYRVYNGWEIDTLSVSTAVGFQKAPTRMALERELDEEDDQSEGLTFDDDSGRDQTYNKVRHHGLWSR